MHLDDSDQENPAAVAAFGQVVAYCVTESCRRALVLGHFGEALPRGSCTGCDCCQQPETVRAQVSLHTSGLTSFQQTCRRWGLTSRYLIRLNILLWILAPETKGSLLISVSNLLQGKLPNCHPCWCSSYVKAAAGPEGGAKRGGVRQGGKFLGRCKRMTHEASR